MRKIENRKKKECYKKGKKTYLFYSGIQKAKRVLQKKGKKE